MKKNTLILIMASFVLASCSMDTEEPALKISLFCDHIQAVAEQKNIPFEDAARMVRDLGYTGVDVWVTQTPEQIRALRSAGFCLPCAIASIDFFEGEQEDAVMQTEKFMKKYGIPRLLLVPGLAKDGSAVDVTDRIASLARDGEAGGFQVMVEDFDHVKSPCHTSADIDRLLKAIPQLDHCFDSGNWISTGEDCMRPLEKFRSRIAHVHLKDRLSPEDMSTPTVGTGIIPITFIIRSLICGGYDGWFTVEAGGSADMLEVITTSFNNVRTAVETEEMTPEMTEYYHPVVPHVDPVETDTAAPDGAVILFNGSDMAAWQGDDGSDAGWQLNGDGSMTVVKPYGSIRTRDEFHGRYHLHVEWCEPEDVQGHGQGCGNSGVFLNGKYEVQVLEAYTNTTYVDGQAASIYKQSVPSANPCRRPGEWNVYDITFTSPVLSADSTLVSRPRITVVFNGVTVQDDFEILGTTEYIGLPRPVWAVSGPISLQDHGDPVSYRNIWLKQL